jgi:hypothetical protein
VTLIDSPESRSPPEDNADINQEPSGFGTIRPEPLGDDTNDRLRPSPAVVGARYDEIAPRYATPQAGVVADGSEWCDYDYEAASEALDGPFNPRREKQLQKQEKELRLLHRMKRLTIPFKAWIAQCRVDLRHLYISERQKLGVLIECTKQQYQRFATDPMGRTRKYKREDGTADFRPDTRFPGSFIPGCLTEAEAAKFRKEINQPKRKEAEKQRRNKIKKANAAAHAALEKDVGLHPMQTALVRVLNSWMPPFAGGKGAP